MKINHWQTRRRLNGHGPAPLAAAYVGGDLVPRLNTMAMELLLGREVWFGSF